MRLLLAAPKNKTMLGQFPPEQLMEKPPGTFAPKITLIDNTKDRTPNPPMPLDTWGNPIIFVPAAGLCGGAGADNSMWVGGPRNDASAKKVVAAPTASELGPIRSADGRPFWASAGPDGDFRTGDDNVYSFEN